MDNDQRHRPVHHFPQKNSGRTRNWRILNFALLIIGWTATVQVSAAERPNVLLILCDDLGYGDVAALNPQCKFRTPHLDRLAKDGVSFTDAHSSSAVCTPTRYGLLTGRYNWRTRLQSGVLGGLSPRLIEPEVRTLADMLHAEGYDTACFGKWHLGMEWSRLPNEPAFTDAIEKGSDGWRVDYRQPFRNGPLSVGFNRYFGIAASLDMVPYTFLDNDRVAVIPTVDKEFPMLLGREQGQTRRGPAAADFDAAQVLPTLTGHVIEYLKQHAAIGSKPFFCYVPLASPHTPIVPTKQWQGHSGTNHYGDFVEETDDAIGRILQTVRDQHLTERTIVIVTSDNGCSPQADFPELARFGHNPSHHFRGHKADIFEGGHRVPYIVSWPGRIPAGETCSKLTGLQDTFATCIDLVEIKRPENVAVDSFSWRSHLIPGASLHRVRESLVHHSINGSFALRRGQWKLCFCGDSGGWSEPRPNSSAAKSLPSLQLYDLSVDVSEQQNLAESQPAIVRQLTDEMAELIARGRSTPGPVLANSAPVIWRKPELP
ncbi:sulfatase family protein [Schlesneria paludicola]|uniref:sulfatase family protein n=1 Tax=Schlesneria paludicola TaxID=360056 RepID=UPI0012F79973|nr:arylsulfatase [Schlesneria paludicola]